MTNTFKDCQYCARVGKCNSLSQLLVDVEAVECLFFEDTRPKEEKIDVQEEIGYIKQKITG